MEVEEKIKKIKEIIKRKEEKLKRTNNEIDKAVLSDEIRKYKITILKLMYPLDNKEKTMTQHIDAPSVADRNGNSVVELSRGQIMNSGDVFKLSI